MYQARSSSALADKKRMGGGSLVGNRKFAKSEMEQEPLDK